MPQPVEMALVLRAFQVTISTETGDLITDAKSGTIKITPIDELMFSFSFGLDSPLIDLVLTQGDASFEVITAETDLIQLELASSGSSFLFSLVDRSIDLHRLAINMNSMLESGMVPIIGPTKTASSISTQPTTSAPKSELAAAASKFAKQLAGIFSTKKANPKNLLTVDNIIDSVEPADLDILQQYLPEGYTGTKQDLLTIVASPYFKQAVSILGTIMDSESAPSFLAQFGLLDGAGDHPVGFAALLRAIQAKQDSK